MNYLNPNLVKWENLGLVLTRFECSFITAAQFEKRKRNKRLREDAVCWFNTAQRISLDFERDGRQNFQNHRSQLAEEEAS